MGKRQINLTEAEIGQFRQAEAQTRDGYELRRLQAIRLYGSGVRLVDIMDVVGAGASSIRQWAMTYRAEGIAGLRSKWHGQNANKLTAEQRALVKARLHQYRPVDLHVSEGVYWTVSDFLQDHPDGQVIALDEMSLYFQATTTRLWSPIGETPLVRVSPQRDQTHFYGALNLRTGHEFALPSPEMSSETTTDFLRNLLVCYPTQPILLLWDRAHWHKGESVKALLAYHSRLETVFFPPACPDLNPQEHVWSQARTAVRHNHPYSTFQQLKHTFLNYLSLTWFRFDWLAKYAPAILFEV